MCIFEVWKLECKECGWVGWSHETKEKLAPPEKDYVYETLCPKCESMELERVK